MSLLKKIDELISTLNITNIPKERRETLQLLVAYIQGEIQRNKAVRITFICTHNSRRSHLAQVWAQTKAHYFGIERVACYSAGTQVSHLFPMVSETLQNAGFQIQKIAEGENPVYSIKYAENAHPIIGFSKKITDNFNPQTAFCAVLTCSQADEDCPFVLGAAKRIALSYEDPKSFDHTPQQAQKYHERSLQIATELKYVFSKIYLKYGHKKAEISQ